MASYANDNSEKYISEKDVKEAILMKTLKPENLDPVENLDDYLQELLKRKKRPQDIVIDNTLEKVQDKVLDIMGPLSKLWVMIEQVNSGSGSSSTVEMDAVLELLEKTVLLIGQCNNTITYKRRKNVLLGVTGTSSSQVASMLKEKAAFLQKHDQAHFPKDFRDHLTGSLKAKKQSIEAIAEIVNLPRERGPFKCAPHFIKEDQMGAENSGPTTTVNYTFCSKRKKPSHGISQISLPIILNMEELTHVHRTLKKFFPKQKIPNRALAGRIKEFLPAWILLALVEGYQIHLVMDPVQEKAPKVPKLNQEQQKQVDLEVKAMLEKSSISKVCHSKGEVLSSLLLISKKVGRNQPVINLKDLISFIPYKHFKMEGLHCLKCVLQKRDYTCKINLKDADFSSSTQRLTKISTVSLGRKLVRVPVPILWFWDQLPEFLQIIKGSDLSFETSDDKGHSLSRRFIDFRKQYERNIYRKGYCDLPIATSRLCNKSEEVCVRSCTRNRVLRVHCEFPNYDFVITKGKGSESKR